METLFSLDRGKLAALAAQHGAAYGSAEPFPHVVLDDVVPVDVLDAVLAEFPSPTSEEWLRFDSDRERKLATIDDGLMGPVTRHLLAELNSGAMIDFLHELTGIEGLVPDPHLVGGGLHQIEAGGFLEVHADFNLHPLTGLYRRLNLLLYLNRDWDPTWGGALELWDQSMTSCRRRVDPELGRCVIFSTTDRAYHGHPEPLATPPGVTRKSLALYYYARVPDPTDGSVNPHNTLFQHRGIGADAETGARRSAVLRHAQDLLPPIVVRVARRARARTRR